MCAKKREANYKKPKWLNIVVIIDVSRRERMHTAGPLKMDIFILGGSAEEFKDAMLCILWLVLFAPPSLPLSLYSCNNI